MFSTIDFRIKGLTPLIMHSARLLDPNDELSVEMRVLTSIPAKKKTPENIKRIKDIEWLAGIYIDEQGRPIIPGANIEAAFCEGAKSLRMKPTYEVALVCPGDNRLIYDGPKTASTLIQDPHFRDVRRVVIPSNGNSVMRCRPIFVTWSLEFQIQYFPDMLYGGDIVKMLQYVGRLVGICDYTPKYGRFLVDSYVANPPIEEREMASSAPKSKAKKTAIA